MLDDEVLIETLKNSKKQSLEIEQRMKESSVTSEKINNLKNNYEPIADVTSQLYFVIL